MDELVFVRPGETAWRDVPPPRLQGPGDALVRPVAVATCDLDAAIARGVWPATGPFPLGHEFIGEVLETSDPLCLVRPGALVAVPFQISCGTCDRCRRGLTANCRTVPERSMFGLGALGGNWGGALSDVVRVPFADHMLVPLPPDVDPAVAASAGDNIADAWRAVGPPLAERPHADVLVVGGGGATSIGFYATALALALGASSVEYVDHDEGRLATAERLGARPMPADGKPEAGIYEARFPRRLGPYPITVDASAHPAGLALAMRSTEPGGICTNVGVPFELSTPVPLLEAYGTGLTLIVGRAQVRPAMPEVLTLIADGRLDAGAIISTVAKWDEAPEVMADPPDKAVIVRAATS